MEQSWPSTITKTIELRSQRGPSYEGDLQSYSDVINAFLKLGWRIITTYVEDKGPESSREECVTLMGWSQHGNPKYPTGYGE